MIFSGIIFMNKKDIFLIIYCFIFCIPFANSQVIGVTDSEITFGTSAAFSGTSKYLGLELYRGAMAYFNYINNKGGVHGRKIKIMALDDGYQLKKL